MFIVSTACESPSPNIDSVLFPPATINAVAVLSAIVLPHLVGIGWKSSFQLKSMPSPLRLYSLLV